MKTSIKLNFITVLLIPIIICIFFYWATYTLETSSRDLPPEETYNLVKSTQDINRLRELSALTLDIIKDTNKDNIEMLNTFLHFLIAISITSIICTLTIISYYRKQASNKSSNLTGEKDSPSS